MAVPSTQLEYHLLLFCGSCMKTLTYCLDILNRVRLYKSPMRKLLAIVGALIGGGLGVAVVSTSVQVAQAQALN